MSSQISAIKKRKQSVFNTQKITNANGLVASVKMAKYRKLASSNTLYADDIRFFLSKALANDIDASNNIYLKKHELINPLHIVISSDQGLCGSYNSELFKYVSENVKKEDAMYVIGKLGYNYFLSNNFMVIKGVCDLPTIEVGIIDKVINDVISMYKENEFSSIDIIYMNFINTLTYKPTITQILPFVNEVEINDKKEVLMEPSKDDLLNELFPMYINCEVYSCLLQAKSAEYASRKNAMDAANKNADELLQTLSLSYNKARQQMITQEMNEIVSGS